MICPKCKERMRVTHTISVPPFGGTQRLECVCGCVATVESVIVAIDPRHGDGARARARKLAERVSQATRQDP